MLDFLRRYKRIVLPGLLLVSALLIYSFNLKNRAQGNPFDLFVLRITSPVYKLVDEFMDSVSSTWYWYIWLVDTEAENRLLRLQVAGLRSENEQVEEIRLENERLRRLLAFRESADLSAIPAEIIGEDSSGWSRTVLLNKGTDDGIVLGAPVVVTEGVVGRVVRAGAGEARVLLVTDPSSSVGALVQRSRSRGVVRGNSDDLHFEFVLRDDDIVVGDRIVTSGMGMSFPKGLLLGKAEIVYQERFGMFQTIEMKPAVDFSRLEEVLVLDPNQ